MDSIKTLLRYFYTYRFYGLYLYILIYWFKRSTISLKGYPPVYLRKGTFDLEIFNQMFIFKQYDFEISGAANVIIDLGANNGLSALFFHKKFPSATIYAVEPDKKNFEMLEKNTKGIDKIVPVNKAVWKENGTVNLDSGDSWAVKVDMVNGSNMAEAITLDSLMELYKIRQTDVLKIDIESAEKEIFEGSTEFLRRTDNIFIELHDWLKPGCAEVFFRALNNYSYHYTISRENTIIRDLKVSPGN